MRKFAAFATMFVASSTFAFAEDLVEVRVASLSQIPEEAGSSQPDDSSPGVPAPAPVEEQSNLEGAPLEYHSDPTVVSPAPMACPPTAKNKGPKCDEKKKKELAAKVGGAYKGVFYANDFSYLNDPCYKGCLLGECFKQNKTCNGITWDIGGQYRMRHHSERNHRGLGLTGRDDDFLLHRTRIFGNMKIGDGFRAYAEYIDAVSNYERFTPRPIEENRSDIQNLFFDARMVKNGDNEIWARVGRQELLYGAQRTISPLDWANTRRSFEGYKIFAKTGDWQFDAFYTNPLMRNTLQLDGANPNQEFMGMYSTYTGNDAGPIDFYFLTFNNLGVFNYDTIGMRHLGSNGNWLWEVEGAHQWGNTGNAVHSAFAYTAGVGRKFPCLPWKPTLWGYIDWAKGGNMNNGVMGYHHLFPLAHKYNGFMDLFGRRNLEDINFQLAASPTKKLKLLAWYHIFHLQTINDTPYNVNMTPFNPGNAPGSTDLGQELDFIAALKLTPRQNLVFGYSHFWAGSYYSTTTGAVKQDADFYYTQYQLDF